MSGIRTLAPPSGDDCVASGKVDLVHRDEALGKAPARERILSHGKEVFISNSMIVIILHDRNGDPFKNRGFWHVGPEECWI